MLFTSLLSMSHSASFLYTTQDHLFRSDTAHSELGPPISIVKQNFSQACLQTSLMEAFFNSVFFSHMTLACFKLIKSTSMVSFIPLGVTKKTVFTMTLHFILKENRIVLTPFCKQRLLVCFLDAQIQIFTEKL